MTIPHHLLTPTRHGLMLANVYDAYVGRSLIQFGEFSEHEVRFLAPYLGPTDVVLDIGANIGALTIPFARLAGSVMAFEPQRICHQLLCANVALNSLTNVMVYQYAIGDPEGGSGVIAVPVLDPTKPNNFGGVSLGGEGEDVFCMALDALRPPPARLVKVDVEGMEANVLRGGRDYIAAHKPLLYVENDRGDKSAALLALIHELGYDAYAHRPPLYRADNFKRQGPNPWPGVVSLNLFCQPKGEVPPIGLEMVA